MLSVVSSMASGRWSAAAGILQTMEWERAFTLAAGITKGRRLRLKAGRRLRQHSNRNTGRSRYQEPFCCGSSGWLGLQTCAGYNPGRGNILGQGADYRRALGALGCHSARAQLHPQSHPSGFWANSVREPPNRFTSMNGLAARG